MRLLMIFFAIYSAFGAGTEHSKPKCEGIEIGKHCYIKEILSNGINRPYHLSHFNHTVFFSYNVGDDDKDTFEIGYVTSGHKVPVSINSTTNGFATAIDKEKKIAYFGGSDGIYEHDLKKPGEIKHVMKGHNIWQMFYKHHLYFIDYPSRRLHKRVGNHSELVEHIHEKIYQFAIDGNENSYITNKSGVYEIKNGTTERTLLRGPKVFRAIAVNDKGVPYFCSQSGIYIANKTEQHVLEEVVHIKNIFGLTFDSDDHFIYSDPHQIIKLLPQPAKKT